MFQRIILVFFLSLLLATSAWSAIQPGSFTLSPMAGGHIFDDDQDLEESILWSIGLGYSLTNRAALEAVYSQANADGETATDSDAKVRTFRLDALYHFRPDNALVPYLAIGLGEINSNPEIGQNSEHLLTNIGGGIKYFISEGIALRADVRYLLDFPEPENNLLYSAGLLFQFGNSAPAPEPVVTVHETPIPAPIAPIAPIAPKDSDSDGVIDDLDNCPATPMGTLVDSLGCPLDSDADGVLEPQDKCPNTPIGVSVDTDGCPSKLTLQINFGLDSDNIGPEYDGEISKAAECINSFPGNRVYIDGHTDSLGPARYNQQLSERRATAVKNRLVEKFNIPASRMTARGFGESTPVAENATQEGQFQNRRVEVACGATE